MNSIRAPQIDALLRFLNQFAEGRAFAHIGDHNLSECSTDSVVTGLLEALDDNGWVNPEFNWPEWQDTAQEYVKNPERLENIDVVAIQKLFTTHVRMERYCEGHLAAMFESGHIVALLHRLEMIQKEMEG